MCYFSIVTDELASGDAWALGPHRLVCGEDSDAAAFPRSTPRSGAGAGRSPSRARFPEVPVTVHSIAAPRVRSDAGPERRRVECTVTGIRGNPGIRDSGDSAFY